MTYEEKAYQIIKDSIKSAVFIDEKARSFYQSEQDLRGENEEKLSVNLYENFRKNGISLAIHKFSKGEENNEDLKKYFFEGRDLVLLDWKLDGESGEDLSLCLLAEVSQAPHINFCAIYTSEENTIEIFASILAFFSGKSKDYYEKLKTEYEAYEDDLKPIFSQFNIVNKSANAKLIPKVKEIDEKFLDQLKESTNEPDYLSALNALYIAFQNFHLPDVELTRPDLVSPETQTLVINNTLIAVLQKEGDQDVSHLIKRLSSQFAKSKNSFTQLLGFEMQSVFSREGAFIDSNLLKVSREALFAHRKYILENDKSDVPFQILIKKVLIEHASMRLRTSKLALLDKDFLEDVSTTITEAPSDESLAAMNVFYNSVKAQSFVDADLPSLDFGDVFRDQKGNYFICITALCDCYLPSKIDNIYYFAKGQSISNELALTLGDSAFISFLPGNTVVSWIAPEPDITKPNGDVLEDNELVSFYRQFKYKPVYVKPVSYHVKSHKITDNAIEIRRIETKKEKEDIDFILLDYITTIRPNYAQRIANHAFSHPVRVGVDFVKKP